MLGRELFRKKNKNIPAKKVVAKLADQQKIIKKLHNRSGHKEIKSTFRKVANIYY